MSIFKNIFLAFLFLAINLYSFAQDTVSYYYEDGAIKEKGILTDGQKEGCWTYFYPDGTKNATECYQNGILLGQVKNYDFHGNLISLENFVDGMESDSAFYYYSSGQVKRKGVYAQGLYDGEWLTYYENGGLKQKGSYLNGMPHGQWIFYNEEGMLTHEGHYKKAKESGYWKIYSDKGYLELAGEMYNGKRIGVWREYNKRGKVKKTIGY